MSASAWGAPLYPAHCNSCRAGFLVPANAGAPVCPNCLTARLEPVPALENDAPPELIVPFTVAEPTLYANLERWLRDIPFKAPTLTTQALRGRLTRVFVPLYLADVRVSGAWNAQMGFDYLVASSEERYNSGQWVTQRLNETRIRWEPRAGTILRGFENVPAAALENHARLMRALGNANGSPFDTTRAVPFAADSHGNTLVRTPDIAVGAAWDAARLELERRAANDCQAAASAQHHEKFTWQTVYGEPHWTLLLLPTYVTSYQGDDNKWIPVRVNGQTGYVSGTRRASIKSARGMTLVLGGIALIAFVLTVILFLVSQFSPQVQAIAGLGLLGTFFLCLAAPVPLIIAWQYNHSHADD